MSVVVVAYFLCLLLNRLAPGLVEGSSPYLEWDELELKTSQVCL